MDPAERVRLGRSDVFVSRLGLGTAPLGNLFARVQDDDADATVTRSYEEGLRLFDTAPLYGSGLAEQRLGRALRAHRPGDYVLGTKVGRLLRAGAPPEPGQFHEGRPLYMNTPPLNPVFDFSPDGVLRSLGESLERLGLERIDILQIHDPDAHYDEALGSAYPTLDRLRQNGVIGAVGVGMNQVTLLARFARDAAFDCFLVAGRYTLLDQSALDELLPLCLEKRIGVIAGGVFNSGILAAPRPGATFNYLPAGPAMLARAQRLDAMCAAHGVPLSAAAIQFPLGHQAVTAVVVGCRSAAEVEQNVRMFRHRVPAQLWRDLRREGLLPPHAPAPGENGVR
jgi:D-threo-aldose 1-dehydrogenase